MPTDPFTPDEVIRDQWGRYLIVGPDNGAAKPYTRATTIAGLLDDKTNLAKWQTRMAIDGLRATPELGHEYDAATGDTKTQNQLIERALESGGGREAQKRGSWLHALTEASDRGTKIPYAPLKTAGVTYYSAKEQHADIDAWNNALKTNGLTLVDGCIERVVVHDRFRIAGTFDRILRSADGALHIADLKTGSLRHSWQSIGIQLAIYASADAIYNSATGFRTALPEGLSQTVGLVIHVANGASEIHAVDLTKGLYDTHIAISVHASRKDTGGHTPYLRGHTTATDPRRSALKARVVALKNTPGINYLANNWPDTIPTLKTDHEHTDTELRTLEHLIAQTESAYGVPF